MWKKEGEKKKLEIKIKIKGENKNESFKHGETRNRQTSKQNGLTQSVLDLVSPGNPFHPLPPFPLPSLPQPTRNLSTGTLEYYTYIYQQHQTGATHGDY